MTRWGRCYNPYLFRTQTGAIVLILSDNKKRETWVSSNDGIDWYSMALSPFTQDGYRRGCAMQQNGHIINIGGGSATNVWLTPDLGKNWVLRTASHPSQRPFPQLVATQRDGIVLMGGFYGGYRQDVWHSTDHGVTWHEHPVGAPWWTAREYFKAVCMPDGSIVLMGGYNGSSLNDVWRSTDNGATWMQMTASAGWSVRSDFGAIPTTSGDIIIFGGRLAGVSDYANDVWKSSDNGATWTQIKPDDVNYWARRRGVTGVQLSSGRILILGGDAGSTTFADLWASDDLGVTWTEIPDSPSGSFCGVIQGHYEIPLANYLDIGINSAMEIR